jgi:predicted helicase
MRHMLAGENLALLMPRRVEHVGTWQHAFVCDQLSEHVAVSLKTIDYHFPLYLYPEADRRDLFSHLEPAARRPNLNGQIVAALAAAHGRQPSPEAIFNYVYAVLYAPTYRARYAEFLRLDFPRIPLAADRDLFDALAALGGRLVALHLLRSPELDPPLARFEGAGDGRVAKGKGVRYDADAQRVTINAAQYFAPVPPEVWAYQVGGYQVCHKWLKDRAERQLSLDEVRTYCRIVTALARTIEIQREIDALYAAAGEGGSLAVRA